MTGNSESARIDGHVVGEIKLGSIVQASSKYYNKHSQYYRTGSAGLSSAIQQSRVVHHPLELPRSVSNVHNLRAILTSRLLQLEHFT
jgi:hypothetical protein